MSRDNALARAEAELCCHQGRRGRAVLERWARVCPLVSSSGLRSPRDLPAWVWSLGRDDANCVLRMLVEQAQAGDHPAVVAVVACLRPGLCALAGRTGLPVDELVSEVVLELLRFPVARRASVAGQLLLDARRSLSRQRAKARDVLVGDTRVALEGVEARGELGVELSPPDELAVLVAEARQAGALRDDDARLILETRVGGDPVAVAAARRSVTRTAAYLRRQRAEARLVGLAGGLA